MKARAWLRGWYDVYNFGDDMILLAWYRFLRQELGLTDRTLSIVITNKLGSLQKLVPEESMDVERVQDIITWFKGETDLTGWSKLSKAIFYVTRLLAFETYLLIGSRGLVIGVKWARELQEFLRSLTVIHYVGGGYFAGRWVWQVAYELIVVTVAQHANPSLRIVGTGLGVGPFGDGIVGRFQRLLLRMLLRRFDVIYVREKYSLDEVLRTGISPERVRCLGDDVLLWMPEMHASVRASHNLENLGDVLAVNLKDFPDHRYHGLDRLARYLAEYAEERGLRLELFLFGEKPGPDDRRLAREFARAVGVDFLPVWSPYREGVRAFLCRLMAARVAVGAAYHFGVLRAMGGRAVTQMYAGDYYRQKICGAMDYFGCRPPVALAAAMRAPRVLGLYEATGCGSCSSDVESLRRQQVTAYTALYQVLLGSARPCSTQGVC